MDRGSKLINKASNKRLAIGLGLSSAAGLRAAYGVNKALKNKNNKKNNMYSVLRYKAFSGKFASKAADAIEYVIEIGENKFGSPTKTNKLRATKTNVVKWAKRNPKAAAGLAAGTAALGTGAAIYSIDRRKKKK